MPPRAIANRLKFVLNDEASNKAPEFPLGVLTSENRDTWAAVREHLVDIHNESALDTIDSALFVLALDDKANYSADDPVPIVQNMLHGDANGYFNRWYDKSFSLIVCKDGNAGINFEHSWGDGMAYNISLVACPFCLKDSLLFLQELPFCVISMKSTKRQRLHHFAIHLRCTAVWLRMLAMTSFELVCEMLGCSQ